MRLLIICILIWCFNLSSFSQIERINCTIFIDGKLPDGSWVYDEYFSYSDSLGVVKKIKFDYVLGEIQLTSENAKIIHSLSSEDTIIINFTHKKYKGGNFNYSGTIKVAWLSYQYLVIRITNLSKKKGDYYFGYSTPDVIKKFIKQEYNMFEDY
jgi:hypothetical protein